MPKGACDDPVVIDPGLKFKWAVLRPTCDMECEQQALLKDVTPQIRALDPGQCFVFPVKHTTVFERVQDDDGHPGFVRRPFTNRSKVYYIEEPEADTEPGFRQRVQRLWNDNNPFPQLGNEPSDDDESSPKRPL